jgi:hypothetical protein
MKNLSIRFRILALVVGVNVVGAIFVGVFLHESYSQGLDVAAAESDRLAGSTWEALSVLAADELGDFTDPKGGMAYAKALKGVTGADYGILIDKAALDAVAYGKAREAAGLPNNWDELETYALVAATDETHVKEMNFRVPAADVPESGKVVGVKNGACAKTCHDGMEARGDYWIVAWSDDSRSEAHSIYPIVRDGKAVGVIYTIANISAQADSAKKSMVSTMLFIGFTLLVATLLIGMMLDLWIFRRMQRMIASMEDISVRVAGGDFDAHFKPGGSGDEIGQFETWWV